MFLVFYLLWIIFNGKLTLEIALFGLVFSGIMYAFICKFLDYEPRLELILCKKASAFLHYIIVLLKEIIKANFAVIKMIFTARYELEPAIVRFRTDLKTDFTRVLLANSITLTPGTITVSLEGDEYVVHCLDKSLAEGIDNSECVELLRKMERMD